MQTLIDMDELPKLVRDFVSYKVTVQGRAKKTMDEYALDLRTFLRWLAASREGLDTAGSELKELDISSIPTETITSVTPDEIYAFLYYTLEERQNQTAARARKLSALKSFYKYLTVSVHLCDSDPTKNIEGPHKKQTLPKFLSLEESEALLDAVRNDTESKTTARDYCILTLFLNCGMRLSELCNIDLSDVDRDMQSLRVLGKGSKERLIYLNDACRDSLRDWLAVRNTDPEIKDKNALFLSSRHTRISNKTVQWMVYKYLDAAGLGNKSLSTHKLRHTAATLMYRTGKVDVRVLKDILGHEQLNTTQIYTHVSDEGMRRAIDDNPLAHHSSSKPRKPEAIEDEDIAETETDKLDTSELSETEPTVSELPNIFQSREPLKSNDPEDD